VVTASKPAITRSAVNLIEVSGYTVVDNFFGAPYVDVDEWSRRPGTASLYSRRVRGHPHRVALCFPPADLYRGRLYQPLERANAGHEDVASQPLVAVTGGVEMVFRLGGYQVESNMGHIGDVEDPKAGEEQETNGTASDLSAELVWTYQQRGTYFPTALVESHREGDFYATTRRIPNLDSARVVVT